MANPSSAAAAAAAAPMPMVGLTPSDRPSDSGAIQVALRQIEMQVSSEGPGPGPAATTLVVHQTEMRVRVSKHTQISHLTEVILLEIMKLSHPFDTLALGVTCRRFYRLSIDNTVWRSHLPRLGLAVPDSLPAGGYYGQAHDHYVDRLMGCLNKAGRPMPRIHVTYRALLQEVARRKIELFAKLDIFAKAGCLDAVKIILTCSTVREGSARYDMGKAELGRAINAAAEEGHLHIVRALCETPLPPFDRDLQNAAINACKLGHREVVAYLSTKTAFTPEMRKEGREAAAHSGDLDALRLFTGGDALSREERLKLVFEASRRGRLNIVTHFCPALGLTDGERQRILELAASRGHLNIAQFIAPVMVPPVGEIENPEMDGDGNPIQPAGHIVPAASLSWLIRAAATTNLPLVQFLWPENRILNIDAQMAAMSTAARHNKPEILRWLIGRAGEDFTLERRMEVIGAAGQARHLALVESLIPPGHVLTEMQRGRLVQFAAAAGDVERLERWLPEGAQIDLGSRGGAIFGAGAGGHYAIASRLLTPEILQDAGFCTEALESLAGSPTLVERILQANPSPEIDLAGAFRRASERGHTEAIRLLKADPRMANVSPEDIEHAARTSSYDKFFDTTLAILENCPPDSLIGGRSDAFWRAALADRAEAMEALARNGAINREAWLIATREAAKTNRLSAIQFIATYSGPGSPQGSHRHALLRIARERAEEHHRNDIIEYLDGLRGQ